MRRRKDRIGKRKRYQSTNWALWLASGLAAVVLVWALYHLVTKNQTVSQTQGVAYGQSSLPSSQDKADQGVARARIMAHGDLLYHDLL